MLEWFSLGFLANQFRAAVGRPRDIEREQSVNESSRGYLSSSWTRSNTAGQLELLTTDELIRREI